MTHSRRTSVCTSLLLALLAAGTAGCDHFYSVSGRVRSCADERPIAGAEVSITLDGEGAPKVEVTAADGSFSTAFNAPHGDAVARLHASKAGFVSAQQAAQSEQSVYVCLEPEAVARVGLAASRPHAGD